MKNDVFDLDIDNKLIVEDKNNPNIMNLKSTRLNNKYLISQLYGIPLSIIEKYPSWYLFDDGLYYFKTKHAFLELFLSELCSEFNLPCVDFKVVKGIFGYGVISKSIRYGKGNCYDYRDFFSKYNRDNCYGDILTFSKSFDGILNEVNKESLLFTLNKLLAFDFFTAQRDRRTCNITLVDNNNYVSMCPLYDNGSAVNTIDLYNLDSCLCYLSFYEKGVGLSNDIINTLRYLNNNLLFFLYLEKSLNIDINSIINRTIEKYSIELNQEDRNKIIKMFDSKKEIIEENLSLSKRL